METPEWYTDTMEGDERVIAQKRTGLGCINLFLVGWLVVWGLGTVGLIYTYSQGLSLDGSDPISLWFVLAFAIPWLALALLLFQMNCSRKTLRLSADSLIIESRFWLVRWCRTVPRKGIIEIHQQKYREGDEESFSDWGLQIQFRELDRVQFHTLRVRLPFDHCDWLARSLGEWAGVTPKFVAS